MIGRAVSAGTKNRLAIVAVWMLGAGLGAGCGENNSSSPSNMDAGLAVNGAGGSGGGGQATDGGDTIDAAAADGGAPAFDFTPFVGVWMAKTQPQNNDVIFEIDAAGELAGFQATMSFPLAGGTCSAPFTVFSVVRVRGPSLDFPISYFASDLIAQVHIGLVGDTLMGTISSSDGGFAICGSTLTIGTGIGTAAQTFRATKCATCTRPRCRFQGDGTCDEPGRGTGLCFLGTDPLDCGGGSGADGGVGGGGGTGGSSAAVGQPCQLTSTQFCTAASSWCYETGNPGCGGGACVGSPSAGFACTTACTVDGDCAVDGGAGGRCLAFCNGPAPVPVGCWPAAAYTAVSSSCR